MNSTESTGGVSRRDFVAISTAAGMAAFVAPSVLGAQAANVLQILHERTAARYELGHVAVELTLETRGFDHVAEIERAIAEKGYQIQSG